MIFYISELCVLSRHCSVRVCLSCIKLLLAVSIAAAGLSDDVSSDGPRPSLVVQSDVIFIVCCFCFLRTVRGCRQSVDQ